MGTNRFGIRKQTSLATRQRIADVALAQFLERGYDTTTVDDIAAIVGVSQRTVARHFVTKQNIALYPASLALGELLDALRGRPAGEPGWTSLRRAFDVLTTPDRRDGNDCAGPLHRIAFETPPLLAAYLQMLHRTQAAVSTLLRERATSAGTPYADDDPTPGALTAAAFGCLVTAQRAWLTTPTTRSFACALDSYMSVVGPNPVEWGHRSSGAWLRNPTTKATFWRLRVEWVPGACGTSRVNRSTSRVP